MRIVQTVSGGSGSRFVRHTGIAAPFLEPNVNTDVIQPINPNSLSEIHGLSPGGRFFEPLRYLPDGSENPDFILNQEPYRNASILLLGENFGTGSSRGVTLPMAFGIRVMIGPSFAPNFYVNSLRQGLLAVPIGEEVVATLADWALSNPGVEMTVDLERNTIEVPGMDPISFRIDAWARNKLLLGLSDMDEMLPHSEGTREYRTGDRSTRPWIYSNATGANR